MRVLCRAVLPVLPVLCLGPRLPPARRPAPLLPLIGPAVPPLPPCHCHPSCLPLPAPPRPDCPACPAPPADNYIINKTSSTMAAAIHVGVPLLTEERCGGRASPCTAPLTDCRLPARAQRWRGWHWRWRQCQGGCMWAGWPRWRIADHGSTCRSCRCCRSVRPPLPTPLAPHPTPLQGAGGLHICAAGGGFCL